MWWAGSERIEAYVGSTMLGLRVAGQRDVWLDVLSVADAISELRKQLQSQKQNRRHLRVWLSAGQARPFIVSEERDAQNDEELAVLARSMAPEATGMSGDLVVWAEPWRPRASCVAVSMSAIVLGALHEACHAANVRLSSVKPWWNLAINAARTTYRSSKQVTWSLCEPDGLTVGSLTASNVVSMDSAGVVGHDPGWTHMLQRIQLSQPDHEGWHADAEMTSGSSAAIPIGRWTLRSEGAISAAAPATAHRGTVLT